jgi:hypothetical protein
LPYPCPQAHGRLTNSSEGGLVMMHKKRSELPVYGYMGSLNQFGWDLAGRFNGPASLIACLLLSMITEPERLSLLKIDLYVSKKVGLKAFGLGNSINFITI